MNTCGKFKTCLIALCTSTLFLSACTKDISIPNFDTKLWKSDLLGCKNLRSAPLEILLEEKEQLFNQKNEYIIQLLGEPDKTIYFERARKTIVYYVSPGEKCATHSGTIKSLRIDINALGRVELVYVISQ
jgi:hypothetical protein